MNDPSLWKDREFNVFWVGQTLSALGDAFTTVAFSLLVYETTGSIEKMAAITAYMAGGAILSGLVAGPLVDRTNRRNLLLWSDLLRALLMAAIPAASWAGAMSFSLLAAVAVAMGMLSNVFNVGYVAFLPELVSKARVAEANARLDASSAASFVIGPALAGFATQAWGAQTAIGIDALSFLVSFASLLLVRRGDAPPSSGPDPGLAVGLRFLVYTPVLRTLTLTVGAEMLLTAAALNLFTFHLKDRLGQTDAKVGTMFAVASLGSVLGAALSSHAQRRLGLHAIYVLSAGMLGAAFAALPYAGSFGLTAAVAVVFAFSSAMRAVLSRSRRQEVTPDHLLGRVTAPLLMITATLRVLGATAVGLAADRYGFTPTCAALACALFALMLLTVPARSLRT
jgi:MFS family permease